MANGPTLATGGRPTPGPERGPAPDVVGRRVLAALGRPPGLYRVNAAPLWQSYFRVNVLTGPDPATIRTAHSYFIEVSAEGAIIAASPPIVRLYA